MLNKCYFGDCREVMYQLIAEGVKAQMCVTSPPYYGLRDYGHHGQLGLEETPEKYIENMVEVFRLVKELLADDGVLWVNIGDSYFSDSKGSGGPSAEQDSNGGSKYEPRKFERTNGVKPKDLIGIPWMLAFALRADGWYLRQDIIWAKPNPMPESVTDRCTKSHEYIFLLSKSKKYYFNAAAIAEPTVTQDKTFRDRDSTRLNNVPGRARMGGLKTNNYSTRNKRDVWLISTKSYKGTHFAVFPEKLIEPCILAGSKTGDTVFDPFMGSGTVAKVAQRFGRKWLGCEVNISYKNLQDARLWEAWKGKIKNGN